MAGQWDDMPRWVREGRTGPGPVAPRYARRKDRAKVRRDWAKAQNSGCAVLVLGLVALGSAVGSGLHYLLS